MTSNTFDVESIVQYWLTEADEALQVACHLAEKADYSYALFFGHLAIEKALKALYALKLKDHAPPIHNLLRLAKAISLELDDEAPKRCSELRPSILRPDILMSNATSAVCAHRSILSAKWRLSGSCSNG